MIHQLQPADHLKSKCLKLYCGDAVISCLGLLWPPVAIRVAIETRDPDAAPLDAAQKLAMDYVRILTCDPAGLTENHAITLRDAGYTDGEILEINQVSAYFSYANRTVLGLGCSTKGDILGLSPNNSNDPDNWSH